MALVGLVAIVGLPFVFYHFKFLDFFVLGTLVFKMNYIATN